MFWLSRSNPDVAVVLVVESSSLADLLDLWCAFFDVGDDEVGSGTQHLDVPSVRQVIEFVLHDPLHERTSAVGVEDPLEGAFDELVDDVETDVDVEGVQLGLLDFLGDGLGLRGDDGVGIFLVSVGVHSCEDTPATSGAAGDARQLQNESDAYHEAVCWNSAFQHLVLSKCHVVVLNVCVADGGKILSGGWSAIHFLSGLKEGHIASNPSEKGMLFALSIVVPGHFEVFSGVFGTCCWFFGHLELVKTRSWNFCEPVKVAKLNRSSCRLLCSSSRLFGSWFFGRRPSRWGLFGWAPLCRRCPGSRSFGSWPPGSGIMRLLHGVLGLHRGDVGNEEQ